MVLLKIYNNIFPHGFFNGLQKNAIKKRKYCSLLYSALTQYRCNHLEADKMVILEEFDEGKGQ